MTAYLPARLGDPTACGSLSAGQHRLLQALVRETTRRAVGTPGEVGNAAVTTGTKIDGKALGVPAECTLLESDGRYVGFNGNGKRRGLGYKIASDRGWMYKAGYDLADTGKFLADLADLAGKLGLTVMAFDPSAGRFIGLADLRGLAATGPGFSVVRRIHLRVYASADYVTRWNAVFGWADEGEGSAPENADVEELAAAIGRLGISRRELAAGIGMDPAFLGKLLNGRKPWPKDRFRAALLWVRERNAARSRKTRKPDVPKQAAPEERETDVVLRYLDLGWSVVPQRPGEKKPAVRWKEFQARRPTTEEWANWRRSWPDAGVVLVLGPASGVFAIDVDGREAHDVLIGRLGDEPSGPKVLSGSGDPFRYHLYFRHPDFDTIAKATPWHPKLEFRGNRGLVVLPPSKHKSGQPYRWAAGRSAFDLGPGELPAAVADAIRPVVVDVGPSSPIVVPASARLSPSTVRFVAGVYADGPNWNARLFKAACDFASRGVPEAEATSMLMVGARPWDESEREAALRTIRSAYATPREASRS